MNNENYDICHECRGYGNDYYMDDNGDLICNCLDCSFNEEVEE